MGIKEYDGQLSYNPYSTLNHDNEKYDLSKKYFFDNGSSKAIGYLPKEEYEKETKFKSINVKTFEYDYFTHLILDVNEKKFWHFILEKTKVVELKHADTSDLIGML